MGKYVTVFLVVLLLNHDASMESGTCTYMCSILFTYANTVHKSFYMHNLRCTTQDIIFQLFLHLFTTHESFAFLFSVEKQQRCFRCLKTPPKKRFPLPLQRFASQGGWQRDLVVGFPNLFGPLQHLGNAFPNWPGFVMCDFWWWFVNQRLK